jgi:hypothetical protein
MAAGEAGRRRATDGLVWIALDAGERFLIRGCSPLFLVDAAAGGRTTRRRKDGHREDDGAPDEKQALNTAAARGCGLRRGHGRVPPGEFPLGGAGLLCSTPEHEPSRLARVLTSKKRGGKSPYRVAALWTSAPQWSTLFRLQIPNHMTTSICRLDGIHSPWRQTCASTPLSTRHVTANICLGHIRVEPASARRLDAPRPAVARGARTASWPRTMREEEKRNAVGRGARGLSHLPAP